MFDCPDFFPITHQSWQLIQHFTPIIAVPLASCTNHNSSFRILHQTQQLLQHLKPITAAPLASCTNHSSSFNILHQLWQLLYHLKPIVTVPLVPLSHTNHSSSLSSRTNNSSSFSILHQSQQLLQHHASFIMQILKHRALHFTAMKEQGVHHCLSESLPSPFLLLGGAFTDPKCAPPRGGKGEKEGLGLFLRGLA